ncbi:tyrosine-type recombinase/integrase [Streptomyces flavofungini]|uniref:tyrosine-type recombinase/integrase n=1 Tax=Streptomyces flavofungini TaxID=68200 RepID=UPI0034E00C5E
MSRQSQDVYIEWRGGTCRVKWWTGERLPSGRKRFAAKGGFLDEDTALDYGRDQRYEIRHGLHVPAANGATPMSQWLDEWLASLDLAHLSLRNYRWAIDSHIRPHFGSKAVGEIGILDVRAFKAHIQRTLGTDNSRHNVMMVLGMVMDDAVAAGLRKVSPVERKRRRGRYKKKKRERKKDMAVAAVDRLARNAEVVFGYSGYALIWTMAMTGMRPAELFGLTREYCYPTWPGSDPRTDPGEAERHEEEAGRYGPGEGRLPAIRVERQVQYEASVLGFYPPKYDSYRTLVIPPFLAEMLQKLLASHTSPWVFVGVDGGCLAQTDFNTFYWRPTADGSDEQPRRAGVDRRPALPPVPGFAGKRMYLIRHGHKEWMDEDGHPRFVVETRMGHELPGVEGIYSNLTPAMERRVAASLQARWDSYRAELAPEEAVEIEPRPVQPRVSALVRDVMGRGITAPMKVLREVQGLSPEARYTQVRSAVQRERERLRRDAARGA